MVIILHVQQMKNVLFLCKRKHTVAPTHSSSVCTTVQSEFYTFLHFHALRNTFKNRSKDGKNMLRYFTLSKKIEILETSS